MPLLRRLAHWLMKEPELEEEALRLSVRGTNLVVERQTLGDTVAPVTLTDPTGRKSEVTLKQSAPGLWTATVPATGVGLYVATDGERKALAHVGPPNPRELADVRSTTEILAPIAQASGGTVRRIGAGDAAEIPRVVTLTNATRYGGDDWIALRSTNATVLEGLVRVPLLGGFLGLAILLSVLALTWAREGR